MAAPASDRRALLVLLAGACLIGTGPIMVRLAGAGPAAIGFWRVAFAVPLLALLTLRAGPGGGARRGPGAPSRAALLAGVLFAADLAFWHYGIHYTSVANSTVLSNLTPVIVTAASWLLFRERPRPLFLLGLVGAVGGAATIAMARTHSAAPGANPPLGDALCVLTALWYSGYFLSVRAARRTEGAAAVMFWATLVSAPCLLLAAVGLGEPLVPAAAWGWAALVGLGLMHVGGQGAIAWALGRLPAALIAVVVLVQPVVASALGWWVFGEAVTPLQGLGAALALAGVAIAQAAARGRPPPSQGEAQAVA